MYSRHRGFTLVEMMIALVVLSFISVGTLTAFRTLGTTHERLVATTERVDELRQVSQFLRNSLRQAMILPQPGFGGTWAVPVPGLQLAGHQELIWFAPFDGVGGFGGLNNFRLYRDAETLRIQLQPHRNDFDTSTWGRLEAGNVLVKDLEEFSIHYRMHTGDPWVEFISEEDLQNTLPRSMRITIKAEGRYWPEIVVSPDQGGA
jgi:general secretion pathway protein J